MATLAHCIKLHSLNPQIAVRIEDVRKQYITEGHPAQVATERAINDIIGQAQAQLDEVVSQINDKIAAQNKTIDDEINDISMDDLGAMFDEAGKSPEQGQANAKPKAPRKKAEAEPPSVKKNTAKDIVADAAKSGVEGLEEAANGLYALFGGGDSTLMSFPAGFNQDTYAAAKPHFATALQKFKEAGQGLREFVAFVRDKFGAGAKMYLMKFVQDMKDGILDKNGNVVKLEGEPKLEGGQDNVPNNSAELPAGEQTEPGGGPEKSSESGSGNGEREGSEDNGENDQGEIAGQPGKPTGDKAGAEDSQGDSDQRNDRLPQQPLDYSITDDDALGKGGAKTKARQNIAAIKIVKKLIEENRQATKEEQAALVKYVGWGASELANGLFPVRTAWDAKSKKFLPVYKEGWESLGKQVRGLLTDEEYEQAKASTVNAHYTSPEVIRSMYAALEQMGFKGGRILEPGSGIGNFLGLLPESLKGSTFTAVEMDAISAAISKYLYPSHDIRHQDFTQTILPDNFFDVAIGNPPFSDTKILSDPRYAKKKFALHDYFFAKTMDKVRPGGLMILVTSRYTMDKTDDKAREYLSKQADFLGAIRLPQTAFKQNAGTDVVTDVIFLRKRVDGEQPAGEAWGELVPVRINKKSVHINQYFASNPGMILGTNSLEGSMYGAQQYTVKPKRGKQLGELFQEAIKKLPRDLYEKEDPGTANANESLEADFAPNNVKEGAFYLDKKGTLLVRQNGVGVKSKATGINKKKIIAFTGIRDAVRNVLYVQLKGHDDTELKAAQAVMEKHYDAFVKKFGALNEKKVSTHVNKAGKTITRTTYPNLQPFRKTDPEAYLVASIEEYNEDTLEATKGDIFTKRVIDPQVEPDIESIEDALNVSLARLGKIDIADIAKLMNIPEEDAIAGLGDTIFSNPTNGEWETDDEYLQGNVKEKLAQAQAAAMVDKKFDKNVKALEEIQPEDLPPSKTPINLGMPIVTSDDLKKFAREIFDGDLQISHNALLGTWNVKNNNGRISVAATTDFGTSRVPAHELLTSALNSKTVVVKDAVPDGSGGTRQVVSKGATIAANVKLEQLKKRFKDWIWEDNDRAAYYTKAYNERYNVFVKQHTNSAFIKAMTFPGVSASIHPYEHQKRIAWRIVQKGNTYMAHSVGAGKTIGSILAGMELKRLGIKKKPMWVIPNHMLKQFSAEFYELYPAARLLIADESQFSRALRQKFIGKIATGNWDGIIITHAAFKKIPLSAQFQADMINEQIEEYAEAYRDAQGDRLKRKKLEAALRKLREKLARVMNDATADRGVTFEESGIDQLFVDEAHEFRKLMFATNQGDMKGVDPNGSNMAFDLFMKIRYLESLTPNRSAVFMSGTPITNTLGEVFSIQRMLQLPLLKKLGLDKFDAWASTFTTTTTQPEAQPSGNYKVITRLGEFQNLETLVGMWADVGDYVHAKDLHYITRPRIKGGGRKMVVADETEVLARYRSQLGERIKAIERRSGPAHKGDDIILSVITDGRHAALDDRFIDPTLPPNPNGKLEKMIGNVFDIWKRTKENKSAQMIFADEGLPQAFEKRGFSPYLEIKRRLIEMGVPEEEIAFMQDFKKSEEKRKLFNQVNNGDVRVLIGSSQAMGTGVNAQERLVALHHLDADRYLPAMIEQREGRIIRQGNSNEEIEIYAYITKGSMDENMWQFLESKQRFIDQFLAGNATVSTTEDIDKGSNLFALAKAMASNNPLILEKATIENQIMRLEALHRSFIDSKHAMLGEAKRAEREIPDAELGIKTLEKAIASRISTKGDKFKMTLDGKIYTDRTEVGKALLKKVFSGKISTDRKQIGSIGGFPLRIYASDDEMTLINYELISDDYQLYRKHFFTNNADWYKDESHIGLIMAMETSIRNLDNRLAETKEFIEQANKKIADAKAREDNVFEHADKLKEKEARLKAINDELVIKDHAETTPSTDNTPTFSPRKGNITNKGGVKYGTPVATDNTSRLQTQIEEHTGKKYAEGSYQEVKVSDDYAGIAKRLQRIFQKKIVFFKQTNPDALDFNGVAFKEEPHTMYINVDGDYHVQTIIGHELLHTMEKTAPKIYKEFLRAALSEMYEDEFAVQHLKLAEQRADAGKSAPTKQETYEEMLGDFLGDNITDQTFWDKVAARMPEIFHDLVKFVTKYLNKIKSKMKLEGMGSSSYFRDVQKVQDAAAKAMAEFSQIQNGESLSEGVLFSPEQSHQIWYSKMEAVLNAKLPGKGVGKMLANMVQSWSKKGEFKKDELAWSGLTDWLNRQGDKVTKQQVLDYLEENNLQIEEVEKGIKTTKELDDLYFKRGLAILHNQETPELDKKITALEIKLQSTKYESKQLPGGKDYRELLITMPGDDRSARDKATVAFRNKIYKKLGKNSFDYEDLTDAEIDEFDEIQKMSGTPAKSYRSPHFGEPNILVHIRFNEREVDGKRVMFLEEVQSDWAQTGRKKGFKTELTKEEQKEIDNLIAKKEKIYIEYGGAKEVIAKGKQKGAPEELKKAFDEIHNINGRINEIQMSANGVPNMPFKDSSKWATLAIKRAIRWAAENGFDRVEWTTGEQQAERYDLSKQISRIRYRKAGDKFEIRAEKGQDVVLSKTARPEELEDVVGKDIVRKMVNNEGTQLNDGGIFTHKLEGLDLKVGGEGMKGFYDKIVPAAVQKYIKKFGAKVALSEGKPSATEYGQQWGFDVTDKMRDTAMGGQPVFSPRKKATPSSEINPNDDKGNAPGDEQGKKTNAIVDTVTGGPDTARDIEQDRLFTMKIFEYRDLAQKKANNIAVQIEQQIQQMAGSTRKWKGPLAYNRLKDSTKARQLSEAMMVYRDLKRDPSAEQTFRDWAKEQLHSGTLGKVETRKLQEKVAILDLASNLSQEQKDFVDNDIDELFKAVGERAQATGLVNTLLDNYVRRLWTLPDKKKFTGLANGYGFKVWTSASKQRTLNTILDGWMAGYDLKVKGIHNSYDQIAREIAGIEADLAFIISGKKTKDLDGHSLFTTSNLDGYEELKDPGFGVWVASGKVAGGPLATDEDGNLTDDSFLLEVNTFGQKVFVAPPDGKNTSTIYEKRQLKAPKQLADMINKVTARDDLFSSIPFMDKASKFNRITKGWILLSSFFHHLAGSRSWFLGVHHGTKINPVIAYKRGLKKIEGMHPIVQLGIKNGLTYGLRQDFDEAYFTEDTVFEQIFKRLDMDKALKGAEWVKQKRNSFTNSLFKHFFAGLKAEAFVIEFTHELNKDKSQDQDRLAERIATLMNADFGGLHLKRMGRNPTLQKFAQLIQLAADWTESNFRTVTGMIPGMNKAISKLLGELPPPPGMDKVYRHFWGRVIFSSVLSTLIPQLLLNAWTPDDRDDLLDFYREQFSSWKQFRRLRWTAVDITKLYHALGVDIPDNQRKTFSVIGHFADPLKIMDIDRLIKAKGSPIVRIADNLFSGTDWAKRPYTGVKELVKTHKTVKKSRYQKTENVFSRLPSAIIGSAKGVLPIQANELISYLMGEQDGWSALFTSAGAHPSNTYTPDITGNQYKELRSNVLRVEREAKALRLGKDKPGAKKLIIKEFGSLGNFYALKHLYVATRTGLTPLNKRLRVLREGKKIPRRAERIEKMKSAIANKQQKFIDRYQKVQ